MAVLFLLAGTAVVGWSGSASAQDQAAPLQVLQVKNHIYLISGDGGNITVQVGDEGVLVVDTGLESRAQDLLATIRSISDKPIRYVIDTHIHRDHIGGNVVIADAGSAVGGGNVPNEASRAHLFAHENVLTRMSGSLNTEHPIPTEFWPVDTYFVEPMEIFFNGESIQLLHPPNAHTDGDTMVYFRQSDVIAAGDVFVTDSYPFIDEARGGSINGIIAALNRIIHLTVPGPNEEGGTMVISGHGRVTDEYGVVTVRDMLTIIRDRIKAMADQGMTLKQVKAAHPTLDYDGHYGSDSGFWTTDQFIETVYREMQ